MRGLYISSPFGENVYQNKNLFYSLLSIISKRESFESFKSLKAEAKFLY